MRCEAAQQALSAAMDGGELNGGVRAHVDGCPVCRSFEAGAQQLRMAVRVQPAEDVPDLTATIMAAVESTEPSGVSRIAPRARRERHPALVFAAAAVVGLLVGSIALGGLGGGPRSVVAVDIGNEVQLASGDVDAYHARYRITEFGSGPDGMDRLLDLSVDFASPERYRLQVRDRTPGADRSGNGELRVDGASWWIDGGRICPDIEACQGGDIGVAGSRMVTGRAPFDADSPMPTDIVLPLASLSGTDAVRVLGETTIEGAPVVLVELAAVDAGPLLDALQHVGTWQPIYPQDRVQVWLDAETWIPRQTEVRSVGGQERAAWAARLGMPAAPRGAPIVRSVLRSLTLDPVETPSFAPGPADLVIDQGFRDADWSQLSDVAGFTVPEPSETFGLEPWRAGTFEGRPVAVRSYAQGLRWMRVIASPDERRVPGIAIAVDGEMVYAAPSTATEPRRVSVATDTGTFVVEGNLTREELVEVAASLPMEGQSIEARVVPSPDDLRRTFRGPVLLPTVVPPGAEPVAGAVTSDTMEMTYARPEREPAGFALRLYASTDRTIPPSPDSDLVSVRVRDVTGRWSPSRHELEWLEQGRYVSLRVPGEDLGVVLRIAQELEAS